MVTRVPGISLGVTAADCAPVLFVDPRAQVIGAAHAGWKGAMGGVLEAAVATMEGLGAKRLRIRAALGPCIGWQAYEVGPEYEAAFLNADPANARFFRRSASEQRAHFDLPGYIMARLRLAGVKSGCPSGRT
jgi:YfiH family protein